MDSNEILYKNESFRIIGAAMEVHRVLGCGFVEVVYQEALEEEFRKRNIPYEREKELRINYKGRPLSKTFRADFVCYNDIILELKAVSDFTDEHYAQIYSYLKASNLSLGILINFGKANLEYQRLPASTKWRYNSSN
ncbi:MAG: GxxExxY protein [Bacteroidales bacterium]|nr:GxxExxY protein [Bacteroidales bacterium]